MRLSNSAISQCMRQLQATERRLTLFLLEVWTSLSYSMLYFLSSGFSECIWWRGETKSLFELHHHGPKWHHCKSGILQRYQVKYWPGVARDDSMLAVALETDSNTADRSSSAEEIHPIVFPICKMISGNFKRKKERIRFLSPFWNKGICRERLVQTSAKYGLITAQPPSYLCKCFRRGE